MWFRSDPCPSIDGRVYPPELAVYHPSFGGLGFHLRANGPLDAVHDAGQDTVPLLNVVQDGPVEVNQEEDDKDPHLGFRVK
jgi:hypothetical protein